MALRAAVRNLRRDSHVEAILLRESMPGQEWVPGLSDLDLTVLMTSTEITALAPFWRRYRQLKRWLPMLGEVDLFYSGQFQDYLQLGPYPTAVLKGHRELYRRSGSAGTIYPPAAVSEEDRLRDALVRYANFVIPRAARWAKTPSPQSERLLAHALRQVEKRVLVSPRASLAVGERLLAIYRALSRACSEGRAARGNRQHLSWRPLGSLGGKAEAWILPDGLKSAELSQLLSRLTIDPESDPLENQFRAFPYPLVLSQSMWQRFPALFPSEAIAMGVKEVPSTAIRREIGMRYVGLCSLAHNWRRYSEPPSPRFYERCSELAGSYLDVVQGRPPTRQPLVFHSLPEGLAHTRKVLGELREQLLTR